MIYYLLTRALPIDHAIYYDILFINLYHAGLCANSIGRCCYFGFLANTERDARRPECAVRACAAWSVAHYLLLLINTLTCPILRRLAKVHSESG